MGTRTLIWVAVSIPAFASWYADNYTLAGVFMMSGAILQMLHALEVKVNRLLDHYGITVTDKEIRE